MAKKLLISILIIVLNASCSIEKEEPQFISGRVTDLHTKQALTNFRVDIGHDGEHTFTDENGQFSIEAPEYLLMPQAYLRVNREGELRMTYQGKQDEYLGEELKLDLTKDHHNLHIPLLPSGVVTLNVPGWSTRSDTLKIYTTYDTITSFIGYTASGSSRIISTYTYTPADSLGIQYFFKPDTSHPIKWELISGSSTIEVDSGHFYVPNSFKFPGGQGSHFETTHISLQ